MYGLLNRCLAKKASLACRSANLHYVAFRLTTAICSPAGILCPLFAWGRQMLRPIQNPGWCKADYLWLFSASIKDGSGCFHAPGAYGRAWTRVARGPPGRIKAGGGVKHGTHGTLALKSGVKYYMSVGVTECSMMKRRMEHWPIGVGLGDVPCVPCVPYSSSIPCVPSILQRHPTPRPVLPTSRLDIDQRPAHLRP